MPSDGKDALHLPQEANIFPKNWAWARLDEVSEVIDCPHSTPQISENGPLMVRSQDIRDGVFRVENAARVSKETYDERIKRSEPSYGDVLYSREGTYFGIAAEVPPNTRVCLGQRMVQIRPDKNKLDFKFLRHWLNSGTMVKHIHGFRDGSVAERLNMSTIRALPVILPALKEQKAIAAVLSAFDDKIELNRQMNATLEEMARALFKSWFVDFDPVRRNMAGGPAQPYDHLFPDELVVDENGRELPLGWQLGTLNEITEFVLGGDWGKDTKSDLWSDAALCIRGADIPDLQNGGSGSMPIRFLKGISLEKRRLMPDDIVLEISGGSPTQSTGRVVWINQDLVNRFAQPLVCSNFCRMLRIKSEVPSVYVYLWLRYLYDNKVLFQYETGTT
jgi:restriction endonuclease S subunit